MPDYLKNDVMPVVEKISKLILKFRVKAENENMENLIGQYGLSSSNTIGKNKNMEKMAMEKLKNKINLENNIAKF